MSQAKSEAASVSSLTLSAEEKSPLHDLNILVNQHNVPVVIVKDDLLKKLPVEKLPFVVFVGESAAKEMAEMALSAIQLFVPLLCFLTYLCS